MLSSVSHAASAFWWWLSSTAETTSASTSGNIATSVASSSEAEAKEVSMVERRAANFGAGLRDFEASAR